MNTSYIRLTCLLVLLFGNFFSGLLPLLIGKVTESFHRSDHSKRKKVVLTFLLHFGGGVLISTCLLSLLPESRKKFENYENKKKSSESHQGKISIHAKGSHGHEENFPLPEFIVLCGFFAAYALEEIVFVLWLMFKKKDVVTDDHTRFCSCAKRHTECSRTFKVVQQDQTLYGFEKKMLHSPEGTSEGEYSGISRPTDQATHSKADLLRSSIITQPVPNYGSVKNIAEARESEPLTAITPAVVIAEDGAVDVIQQPLQPARFGFSTSNLVMVVSLSLHALYQGLTIGLRPNSGLWVLLLVLCLEQTLITFVMGSKVFAEGERTLCGIIYIVLLSVMSPTGILISMFIDDAVLYIPVLVSGIINAIICGTLLYVTFCVVLRRNTYKDIRDISKLSALMIGAAGMAALQYAILSV